MILLNRDCSVLIAPAQCSNRNKLNKNIMILLLFLKIEISFDLEFGVNNWLKYHDRVNTMQLFVLTM